MVSIDKAVATPPDSRVSKDSFRQRARSPTVTFSCPTAIKIRLTRRLIYAPSTLMFQRSLYFFGSSTCGAKARHCLIFSTCGKISRTVKSYRRFCSSTRSRRCLTLNSFFTSSTSSISSVFVFSSSPMSKEIRDMSSRQMM